MSIIIVIILGIVQGLTEFLPVSSSGHLALLESLFHISQSQRLSYTTFLHIGTTLSLLFYFRKKIYNIFINSINFTYREQQKQSLTLILAIIIGTLPVAIIGYFANETIEQYFSVPIYPILFLIITGFILFITKFAKERKYRLTYTDALFIGIAQAIALLPGISRSGATISIALLLGLTREDGFEFSFLLAIPAIIGANILLLKRTPINLPIIPLLISIIIPFTFGLLALILLKNIVIRKKLHYFAYYCWIISLIAIFLILI